jgi:serine/threonine-protein kinase RsbT
VSHTKVLTVTKETDVVLLRMQVRDLARALGLALGDQARISLAASSAAKAIGLGSAHHGQVIIDDCRRDERVGVRVICVDENSQADLIPNALREARWMVDELTVETLPSKKVQITLVKWRV